MDKSRPVEESLIGSVLKNPAQFTELRETVRPEDFETHTFGWCWRAFVNLADMGLRIDTVTLGDELARAGILNEFQYAGMTGRAALTTLRQEGRGDGGTSYAHEVLDYSAKRKLLSEFTAGAEWAVNGRRAVDIQADMMKRLAEIQTPGMKADLHTMTLKQALSAAYDQTYKAASGESAAVTSGFIDLDALLDGGFYAPDLTILAARPGQGKTTLAVDLAVNAAEKGKRVIIFSLEMANNQIAMRIISRKSGVPYGSQLRGKMKEEQWPKYTAAIEELENLPIVINDLPAIQPKVIRRVLRTNGNFDLVIVDYLQLQEPDEKAQTREQEVSKTSRALKAICKDFGVPIIACAQLSRAVEQRTDKRPMLSDLRESGALEQDSDNVIFIHRPDQYGKDEKQNTAEIIIAKHRNGPVGSVELVWRAALTKFENATQKVFSPQ